MKNFLIQHHKTLGIVGALIALVVAIVYLFVVPEESTNAPWLQKSILAYGHSACWFLLSASSALWAIKGGNTWSVRLAYAALIVYVVFIATMLITQWA